MVLKAAGGGFKNLVGKVTVPADWPDQQRVRVVKEDLPAGATVSYRNIKDVGRQMAVKFPSLPAGREVRGGDIRGGGPTSSGPAGGRLRLQGVFISCINPEDGRLSCPQPEDRKRRPLGAANR